MIRMFASDGYNFKFDTDTGKFMRWGKTKEDDPDWCPFGPEIADIEISSGYCHGNCPFCYKDNGPKHSHIENMSLETFKIVLSKFNLNILTQIAFGICDVNSHPEMWDIFKHCRDKNIIPNYTCNGLFVDEDVSKKTKELCGAVAVSLVNKEQSYNAIQKFLAAGNKQVNIHFMLSEETYEKAFEVMKDYKEDPRLKGMKAIVFLQYKPKGSGAHMFHSLSSPEKIKNILHYAMENNIGIGFDSCSAPLFLRAASYLPKEQAERFAMYAEPCESGLFSSYINVKGEFFPCSFMEGMGKWQKGLSLIDVRHFDDIWNSKELVEWRRNLLTSSIYCDCSMKRHCRNCPQYPSVTSCKRDVVASLEANGDLFLKNPFTGQLEQMGKK